jgi:hypothetical protein
VSWTLVSVEAPGRPKLEDVEAGALIEGVVVVEATGMDVIVVGVTLFVLAITFLPTAQISRNHMPSPTALSASVPPSPCQDTADGIDIAPSPITAFPALCIGSSLAQGFFVAHSCPSRSPASYDARRCHTLLLLFSRLHATPNK